MNLNNDESNNIAASVQYVYKHKQRNELTTWRYQEGKYSNKPSDPEYQRKYYALKLKEPVPCAWCGSLSVRTQLNRHHRSKKMLICSSIFKRKNKPTTDPYIILLFINIFLYL